jgi:hypothetical protein
MIISSVDMEANFLNANLCKQVDDAYVGFITQSLDVNMIDINDYIINYRVKDRSKFNTFLFFRDMETIDDINKIWAYITRKNDLAVKLKKRLDVSFLERII